MSDFSIYKLIEAARVGSNADIANAAAPVAQHHTHNVQATDIANLAAALTEKPIGSCKWRANVTGFSLIPALPFVANATDYNLVTLSKRTGAGAAVTVGTANLSGVAGTGFVPIAGTLVANSANTQVAAGDVLTLTITKTGNGVANVPLTVLNYVLEDT